VYVPADGPALRKGLVLVPRKPVEGTFEEAFELGGNALGFTLSTPNSFLIGYLVAAYGALTMRGHR
jgi:hypothetical protein